MIIKSINDMCLYNYYKWEVEVLANPAKGKALKKL